jgi:hypothetical protein
LRYGLDGLGVAAGVADEPNPSQPAIVLKVDPFEGEEVPPGRPLHRGKVSADTKSEGRNSNSFDALGLKRFAFLRLQIWPQKAILSTNQNLLIRDRRLT